MNLIEIDTNQFKVSKITYKHYKKFFFDNYLLYFIGDFRPDQEKVNKFINNFSDKNFSNSNIENLFKYISEDAQS